MRKCQLLCRFPEPDIPSTADRILLLYKAPPFCRIYLSRHRTAPRPASLALHFCRFRRKTAGNASRQNRKYAGRKAGASFWFGETDDDNRAGLWHLIKVSQQFDLIMIDTQNVGFQ